MSNHFHLLPEVPDRETLAPLDEDGLLAALPLLHWGHVVEGVKHELERARSAGDGRWRREIRSYRKTGVGRRRAIESFSSWTGRKRREVPNLGNAGDAA